jgi:2-keto-4-pentenoate hydratase/2-oxohepta-3-ene-1,7-dioic acid hydratase in catechol pathway
MPPMKLATFSAPGHPAPLSGLVDDGRVTAFGGPDGVRSVLAGTLDPQPSGESWSLDEVTLLAPIPRPGTVYAAGLNYLKHVQESNLTPPSEPVVFLKALGSIAPPSGPVVCPEVVEELDYEGELTIVMGTEGRIAGYCIADDISGRDLQRREAQWVRGKGADTFCPIGPWVTTADEIADAGALRLRTWVNDELRQDSTTGDLIFDCDALIAFIAQTCALQPGDLILTGTPGGVGMAFDPPRYLVPGDRVRIEIEQLGAIEHPVR